MNSLLSMKGTSLSKFGGRFPITAIEVWELSDSEKYLLWGSGPDLVIRKWDNTTDDVYITVSGCDSVHNIRPFSQTKVVAAFGGKSLAIVKLHAGTIASVSKVEQLDDLILDFTLRATNTCSSECYECFVGYAHNFVDVATVYSSGEYVSKARIYCPDLSVLFHMAFSNECSSERLLIASGTVFGKIILWNLNSSNCVSTALCRADDHEGVIFRIKWSEDGQRLVSVADDRTVRMWRIIREASLSASSLSTALELVFTAWGHVSRVWDVVFLSSGAINSDTNSNSDNDCDIATCSEDGTVKLWSPQGVCVSTMRGHGHHVWRLATASQGALLVSGGNDASIKAWDVAYQRRTCPEDASSTVTSAPIPLWPAAVDPVPPTEVSEVVEPVATEVEEADPEGEQLVAKPAKKKKPSAASRRANGVCGVRVSPCLRWIVVVLVEGGVWLVRVADTAQQPSAESEWIPVAHLRAVVSNVDVAFSKNHYSPDSDLSLEVAVALLSGENVLLDLSVTAGGLVCVEGRQQWRAHDMRTVNIWLSSGDGSDDVISSTTAQSNARYAITATVKGTCTVWQPRRSGEDVPPRALFTFTVLSQEIATACLVGRCARLQQEFLVLGDARGSISVFLLPVQVQVEGASALPTTLLPVVTFAKVHGIDPVSCIARFNAGFVTTGHDGMLHTYTEVVAGGDGGGEGEVLSWAHTGKTNCLPISTPDQVFVTSDSDLSSTTTTTSTGLYVCGYHGSVYMVVDVHRGYQLLRVEGGGWKRPHCCALLNGAPDQALVRGLPSCLFVCPAPLLKDNTTLQLFGGAPTAAKATCTDATPPPSPINDAVEAGLPLHLGCPGMGRVGYCATFITTSSATASVEGRAKGLLLPQAMHSDYLVVGGEDSCVKVYSVPALALRQEVSLSMNSSLKSLCSAISQASADRGIVVGGGGKLQYYIWVFDRRVGCSSRSALGDVLFTGAEGGIWAKATQDHRILSVHCAYTGSMEAEGGVKGTSSACCVERYAVLLCDSRGTATIGAFEHSVLSGSSLGRHASFNVLQQIQASQCPLLCCALLVPPSADGSAGGALVAVVGDTAGVISVWTASPDTAGAMSKAAHYTAHSMGANALCAALLSDGRLGVFSGGDDQALSCCALDLQAAPGTSAIVTLTVKQGASGSAIKGIKAVRVAEDVASVVTVGYDQRLCLWDVHCQRGEATAGAAEDVQMEWICGAPVNVSDVGSLDVGVLGENGKHVCCVVGEGVQLFLCDAKN